jgi:hypothetical protein
VNGGMVSDSRSLLSAGEFLVVITVALCGAKLKLTDAIGLSSGTAVKNYYVAHLACCLMQ